MQVKIFSSTDEQALERAVNKWLAENKGISITSLSIATSQSLQSIVPGTGSEKTIVIFYLQLYKQSEAEK